MTRSTSCPTIARNPGITWRASIGYGALRLFGVPFRRPPVLWPLAMASIHPSILQKRRRRRVEAIISQALRECSRYLILPIGYPDDRVACSLHSHRPAAAYLHRRAASNCVYYLLLVYFWGSSIVMDVDQEYFCKRAKFPSFVTLSTPKINELQVSMQNSGVEGLSDLQPC